MAPPCVSFFTLPELCDRWGMKPLHVGALVLEGRLTLSVGLPGVIADIGSYEEIDTDNYQRISEGRKFLSGIFELQRNDAWLIIKNGKHDISSVVCQTSNGYIDLDPDMADIGAGFSVAMHEILVRREEVERFEAAHTIAEEKASTEAVSRSGPGAPQKYDWDGFWIEACRHVHDDGIPSTQAAMVRSLLDWFDANGRYSPDQSTVKKKISRLWKALHPSAGSSSRSSGGVIAESGNRANSRVA